MNVKIRFWFDLILMYVRRGCEPAPDGHEVDGDADDDPQDDRLKEELVRPVALEQTPANLRHLEISNCCKQNKNCCCSSDQYLLYVLTLKHLFLYLVGMTIKEHPDYQAMFRSFL